MDVRSAYNSGLTGLQNASAQLTSSSVNIAQTTGADGRTIENQESVALSAEQSPVSLTTELVNLKVAEFQAKSSAKVITTADEMVGTLINTSV
ncbi:flagellar basal body rod C-terminal domain-containing protein [Psychromonas sp. PT13]|uniref:flagellar basal body rod C-terminal domain-containing protein n=1 Tax=Psychromonas sp. PT13 TaxID=3439547 RepID=UPI003EC13362